ncbi:MAG: cell division topological specificity factor MinE [Anaerolineae bacterium]|nr:cell division topological specificity factor MinE [Anaerolineae bacterium]
MMRFLERLFGRPEPSSGEVAKERLRLVLTQDRAGISPALLDTLKDEIIMVISRHVDVDVDGVKVIVTESNRESSLVADIPLADRRRQHQTQDAGSA